MYVFKNFPFLLGRLVPWCKVIHSSFFVVSVLIAHLLFIVILGSVFFLYWFMVCVFVFFFVLFL